MLQRAVLSDQIRETLLTRILKGEYQPGDRLVESQIAKDLGVSQSPVREALRDLVAMHFVEVQPYKGARVRKVEPSEIAEVYPVRAALEELAGQLAAPFLKGNTKDLENIYDAMESAARDEDVNKMASLDSQFHRLIVLAAKNKILEETWDSLSIESRTQVTTVKLMMEHTGLVQVAKYHLPIIEALNEGDPDKSGSEMRAHVSKFAKLFEKERENDPPAD